MDSAGESFEAICAALADRNNILTVKDLCELAGVSRSGYYNWVRSEKNRELREAKDRAAFEQILEAYRFRGYAKGVRGIHMRLLHMGIRMNVKKIRRLMRKYKLTCPIRKPNPYRRLQRSIRMGSAAENLVNREFESHGPRAILLTDITYIPLRGRFCYLSTSLDACTKQVLAYAMSESLEVDFVLETVQLVVKHHGINAKAACSGSLSGLAASSTVCKKSSSGLSSGTLKKSSLCASRRSRAILFMSCCIT